ncbi:(2Fe-2S)-binding protein [[Clostridium] fimetarium]|uniref:Carbon-monoxide dehydrogenase small subunit n=1 Tax=[Clostridium] fimetarium TaxID=99656 RepID=A0A1I0RAR3_9FIRM|nr:(2Fe-2S)-binding protein [[Clostridium] fimetarium]SEW37799.1 carbon-monoxide dehydrogenase small subunit [[Clostridium] fimetarium]
MIEFNLNNKIVKYSGDPSKRLLDILREHFLLTGVKEGCGEGECGACSVLINGRLTNSCITAVGSLEGSCVITVEGFKDTKQYQLLEDTFAKAGAVQCGFCTPGMIMAAQSLLVANPTPTEEDIREAISGNICRCTGYNMIIDAIKMAAEQGEGLW